MAVTLRIVLFLISVRILAGLGNDAMCNGSVKQGHYAYVAFARQEHYTYGTFLDPSIHNGRIEQ